MAEKRGRLLVIEDHEQLRKALVGNLEDLDYEVATAEDEKQGLIKAKAIKPDLVFCDLKHTGLPCLDVLKALKAELPETKVIVTGIETTREEDLRFGRLDPLGWEAA